MVISKSRSIASLAASVLIVILSFTFVPRDIAILAARTPTRQVLDYILNFILFFVVIYVLLTILAFIIKKVSSRSK